MLQPNDQYEPIVEESATAQPAAWTGAPVSSAAATADCRCPVDCPRDHETD